MKIRTDHKERKMVVRDEGEKNKWNDQSEADHDRGLSDAHFCHMSHRAVHRQKNAAAEPGNPDSRKQ